MSLEGLRGDLELRSIPRLLHVARERFGGRIAIVDGDLRLGFEELAFQLVQAGLVRRRAVCTRRRMWFDQYKRVRGGVGPGDRKQVGVETTLLAGLGFDTQRLYIDRFTRAGVDQQPVIVVAH